MSAIAQPRQTLNKPTSPSPLTGEGWGEGGDVAACVEKTLPLQGATCPVLAMGAWFKNTLCLVFDGQAHISFSVGDLDTPDACRAHEETAYALLECLSEKPHCIVHDLHPDFHSSRFAAALAAELQVPLLAVQHHHAHIAAIAAEHNIDTPLLGLALDGVGLGDDGAAWGGELLAVDGANCQRLGHLHPLPLPGGDRAAREPWRMAAAALHEIGRGAEILQRYSAQPGAKTVAEMLQRNLNCPRTSSMGRLFDAASGLLGLCDKMEFEAQAAILLEQQARAFGQIAPLAGGYTMTPSPSSASSLSPRGRGLGRGGNSTIADNRPISPSPSMGEGRGEGVLVDSPLSPTPLPQGARGLSCLDFRPLLAELADCHDPAYGAALFHATLAAGLADWVTTAAKQLGISVVALGGGCFLNRVLTQALEPLLAAQGLRVLRAEGCSPGDSGIAIGQAWVALQGVVNEMQG